MKKYTIGLAALLLLGACKQTTAPTETATEEAPERVVVAATVEELLSNPADFEGKEVAVQGMVTHVCRHGGQKCFIVGEDGETQIRIVPGGDIDEFKVELEGSTVAFKGVFKIQTTEENTAHVEDHEAQAHHAEEAAHSEAEKAEYFLEATVHKEVQL
ncbi:MAG: hypothetical protein R2751_19985 [Bacteroidales bacterium]